MLPHGAAAQRSREWQAHGLATLAASRFVGGGLGLGIRPPGRLGLFVGTTAGDLDHVVAVRAEILSVFRLSPYATSGVRPYAAAGAAVLARSTGAEGYLTLVLGVESRPWGTRGWFVEAGIGGGVRAAAGVRFRRITLTPRPR